MRKPRPAAASPSPAPAAPPAAPDRGLHYWQAPLLALLVAWIYWPALHGAWLWDDVTEITGNKLLRDPAGLAKIWFDPPGPDYFPLKSTVEWFQWQLWHDVPTGYHATSVVLHLLSAFTLWRVLGKLGIRLAWFGALLFAVHPIAVESVAWVAELKNTLSLLPLLLATSAYLDFDERGGWRDYALSAAWFLVAMLCKTSVVMFPVTVLLIGWWKRGRVTGRDLKASAAFFAISAALGLATVWFQQHHAIGTAVIATGGRASQIAVAGLAIVFYFGQCLLPLRVMPIYPRWAVDPPALWQFLPWILIGVVLIWFWSKRQTWGRHALFVAALFLVNLFPVLGFIPMSYMGITWVADHLAYLPLAVLAGAAAAVAGVVPWRADAGGRYGLIAATVVLLGVLSLESRTYAAMFRDEESFWTYALEENPQAWMAHNNLGYALLRQGRAQDASAHFAVALVLRPDYPEAENNLGTAFSQLGRRSDAIAHYQAALRLAPDYADAHVNLANLLFQAGRLSDAISHYEAGLKLRPDFPDAHNNLGSAFAQLGQMSEAADQFQAEVLIRPGYASAHNNLGNAWSALDRLQDAAGEYEAALRIQPDFIEAHNNLGSVLLRLGRVREAREQFEQVLRLRPDNIRAQQNLLRLDTQSPPNRFR